MTTERRPRTAGSQAPTELLHTQLARLKLMHLLEQFEAVAQEAGAKQWSHVEYLARLIEGEAHHREDRSVLRRVGLARFPVLKTLDQFDWSWPKKINRPQIQNLFRLRFIEDKANLIFISNVGLGKSHLSIALGHTACLRGYSVLFTTAVDIINSLSAAHAHGVAEGDKGYIQEISGVHLLPFTYLGAKHMLTGYDHLLFLAGVIFFLYKLKDIALYVSLFAIGHSVTMLVGVYAGVNVNAYLIDAIIGLSVVYKALDNLGAYQRWFGVQPNTKAATLIFGLFHGFGLAAKVQEFEISRDGLLPNLLAFNVGVEIGQLLALGAILIAMGYWRRTAGFLQHAYTANVAMMSAGFMLIGYQLTGLFVS